MADDSPIQDPYQFYNNRYLKRSDRCLPTVNSYANKQTTDNALRNSRTIKLFPLLSGNSSRGKYATSSDESHVKPEEDGKRSGYLPAILNVHDLLPEKQGGRKQMSSQRDVVIVTARDSSVLGEMKVNLAAQSNPYNKFNQQFHSALWFPGCIFLFFLFCMPAILLMRKSDEAYADQDFKLAKKRGTTSTALYVIGVLTGICFYVSVILLTIYFTNSY